MAINNLDALEWLWSYYDAPILNYHGYIFHNGDPGPDGNNNHSNTPENYGNNKTYTGIGTGTRTFTVDLLYPGGGVATVTHISLFYYPYEGSQKKVVFSVELDAPVTLSTGESIHFEYTLSLEDGLF